jgi:hypothetical protein
VFGGIGLGVAVLYFIGIRARTRGHERRDRRATALGWDYDRSPGGMRSFEIRGTARGTPWILSANPDFGPQKEPVDRRPTTTWIAPGAAQGVGALVITQVKLARFLDSKDGRLVSGFADLFTAVMGANKPSSLGELRMVDVGSAKFREQFSVLAADAAAARHFLTPGIEEAMLNWPIKPGRAYPHDRCLTLHLNTRDVVVQHFHELTEMPAIEQLVAIGDLALDRLKGPDHG